MDQNDFWPGVLHAIRFTVNLLLLTDPIETVQTQQQHQDKKIGFKTVTVYKDQVLGKRCIIIHNSNYFLKLL